MRVTEERGVLFGFLFCIAVAFSPSLLGAQTVRGVVTDTSGAAIPGAIVQLLDTRQHVLTSDTLPDRAKGHFVLRAPPIRTKRVVYGIRACAPGMGTQYVFAPFARRERLAIAITLSPGKSFNPGSSLKEVCQMMASAGVRPMRVLDTASFAAKAVIADLEAMSLVREFRALGGPGPHPDTITANAYRRSTSAKLEAAVKRAGNRTERERAAYQLLRFASMTEAPIDGSTRARIRAALRASSPWWLSRRQLMQEMIPHLYAPIDTSWKISEHPAERRRVERYMESMIAGLNEPEAMSELKFSLIRLAFAARDTARAEALLAELLQTQPGFFFSNMAQDIWDPTRPLRVGVQMPEFSFPQIPDTTRRVTNAVLAGKYTLVEFWATWCGPCVGAMPGLHAAAKKYAARNFQIVSISADSAPETVAAFRRSRYPMPWTNAIAPGGQDDALLVKVLGVTGYPRAVLVDPSGKIIAVDAETERDDLTAILDRVLPPASHAP